MEKSLLLGCGKSRVKQVQFGGKTEWIGQLVTLDMNPEVEPDFVFDLDRLTKDGHLPFGDEEFDEIGAYSVLEHIGRQGDWRGYFDEFAEYHRILKWGGIFGIVVPVGPGALGDPGHTRFFHPNYFGFLDQGFYERNDKAKGNGTDYRHAWPHHFSTVLSEAHDGHLYVALKKERWPLER